MLKIVTVFILSKNPQPISLMLTICSRSPNLTWNTVSSQYCWSPRPWPWHCSILLSLSLAHPPGWDRLWERALFRIYLLAIVTVSIRRINSQTPSQSLIQSTTSYSVSSDSETRYLAIWALFIVGNCLCTAWASHPIIAPSSSSRLARMQSLSSTQWPMP